MAEPIAITALAIEAVLGWPTRLHALTGHPVGGFARVIALCERAFNRPAWSAPARRAAGIATVCLLLFLAGGGAWLVAWSATNISAVRGWILIALAAWPALAMRSLDDHVRPILDALDRDDLLQARNLVGRIAGRDTATLDAAGISRAAIESLAESFCDGVVAPLFWLVAVGLPGVWAYKAVNTADSLIGHPEEPLRAFGWAAARCDDVLNLAPARLAGILLCLAGGKGWRVLWRDHARHASPNAGWPEAAMAGALNVRLAGPVRYDGTLVEKPWIGHGMEADSATLRQALIVYRRAGALLGMIVMGMTWLV